MIEIEQLSQSYVQVAVERSHCGLCSPQCRYQGAPTRSVPVLGIVELKSKYLVWTPPVQGPIQSTAMSHAKTRPPSSSTPFTLPSSILPPTTLATTTSASEASIKASVRSLGWTLKHNKWTGADVPLVTWAVFSGVPRTSGRERAPSTHLGAPLPSFPLHYQASINWKLDWQCSTWVRWEGRWC